ncbi:MAG: hypothetical protein LW850_29475 [Planctomycetaceae bacterium]|jgi:hypothetical protein|nr:hypothetical protein [Planctomycetaceae bacterium]
MESPDTNPNRIQGWLVTSGAFFLHFLSLGFAIFPLQTHLRQIHANSVASILASLVPIAGLLTFFLFRFAERRQWTKHPGRLLLGAALGAGALQFLLGIQLANYQAGRNLLPGFIETAICLLMLACAHACCMNLLNHLAVANLRNHAYSARAAGSAGYMLAILATAALLTDETMVLKYHLFLAAASALLHIAFVAASLLVLGGFSHPTKPSHDHTTSSQGIEPRKQFQSTPGLWRWQALIVLVCLTSFCEGAFGLYSHQFLTTNYGDLGYYLFATCILLETILLVCLPFLPRLRKRLLFVGPLGWMLLLVGCLIAQSGWPVFGALALAMALNCPFQVSCNENAHAMKPQVSGLAAIALAQTAGVFCSQWASALLNRLSLGVSSSTPWISLWFLALTVSFLGLVLALVVQRHVR